MVKCDNCGTDNTAEDKFCCICGEPLNHEKTTNNSVNNSKLNLKICNNCGAENNDEDMFCNQCGGPLNKDETTNNETSDRKFNLKLLIPIVAIVLIAIVGFTMINGSNAIVKDVKLTKINMNNPNYNKYQIHFGLVPTEEFHHVRSVKLENVELNFNDGSKLEYNSVKTNSKDTDDDNVYLNYGDALLKDFYYSFYINLNDAGKNHNPNDINHIKADIVINTTTQDNIVIGHIDDDISSNTAKIINSNVVKS